MNFGKREVAASVFTAALRVIVVVAARGRLPLADDLVVARHLVADHISRVPVTMPVPGPEAAGRALSTRSIPAPEPPREDNLIGQFTFSFVRDAIRLDFLNMNFVILNIFIIIACSN